MLPLPTAASARHVGEPPPYDLGFRVSPAYEGVRVYATVWIAFARLAREGSKTSVWEHCRRGNRSGVPKMPSTVPGSPGRSKQLIEDGRFHFWGIFVSLDSPSKNIQIGRAPSQGWTRPPVEQFLGLLVAPSCFAASAVPAHTLTTGSEAVRWYFPLNMKV